MQDYNSFLDLFFEQINLTDLDVSNLVLDHIAYQASSSSDYENRLPEFIKLGNLASEEIIGNRRVAVIELKNPIQYKHHSISTLELIESKEGQSCESQFQHAEFIVNKSFEDYINEYPNIEWDTGSMDRDEFAHLKLNFKNGLTLKFLKQPILDLVRSK